MFILFSIVQLVYPALHIQIISAHLKLLDCVVYSCRRLMNYSHIRIPWFLILFSPRVSRFLSSPVYIICRSPQPLPVFDLELALRLGFVCLPLLNISVIRTPTPLHDFAIVAAVVVVVVAVWAAMHYIMFFIKKKKKKSSCRYCCHCFCCFGES